MHKVFLFISFIHFSYVQLFFFFSLKLSSDSVLDALDASVNKLPPSSIQVSAPLGMCNHFARDTHVHKVLKALSLKYPLLPSLSSKTNSPEQKSDFVLSYLAFTYLHLPHSKGKIDFSHIP